MALAADLEAKVSPYFDILEVAMEEGNVELAEIMLARISPYSHLLDDEHIDYYYSCQYGLEQSLSDSMEEYYSEPTEYDEWQSFDADC